MTSFVYVFQRAVKFKRWRERYTCVSLSDSPSVEGKKVKVLPTEGTAVATTGQREAYKATKSSTPAGPKTQVSDFSLLRKLFPQHDRTVLLDALLSCDNNVTETIRHLLVSPIRSTAEPSAFTAPPPTTRYFQYLFLKEPPNSEAASEIFQNCANFHSGNKMQVLTAWPSCPLTWQGLRRLLTRAHTTGI